MQRAIHRRDFLKLTGVGGVVFASGLAGCASHGSSMTPDFHFVQSSPTRRRCLTCPPRDSNCWARRRDVIDGQTTATLVYRRRRHMISTFVRPTSMPAEMKVMSVRGFNVIRAARNGMEYWVVSDLNPRELGDFAELVLEGK